VPTLRLRRGKRGAYLVTNARRPMSEDIRYRQRRYLIMMGIRVVGLVLAVFLFHGVARFIAAAVAIVMPYFAVVFANGGREPDSGARFQPYDPERPELTTPSASDEYSGSDDPGSDDPASDDPASDEYPGSDQPSSGEQREKRDETGQYGEPGQSDPWADGDGRPGGKDSFSDGQGSLTPEEGVPDPASQSRTRSNRA
jgi:hypothetical protein